MIFGQSGCRKPSILQRLRYSIEPFIDRRDLVLQRFDLKTQ
jgi:hypothetical protein